MLTIEKYNAIPYIVILKFPCVVLVFSNSTKYIYGTTPWLQEVLFWNKKVILTQRNVKPYFFISYIKHYLFIPLQNSTREVLSQGEPTKKFYFRKYDMRKNSM